MLQKTKPADVDVLDWWDKTIAMSAHRDDGIEMCIDDLATAVREQRTWQVAVLEAAKRCQGWPQWAKGQPMDDEPADAFRHLLNVVLGIKPKPVEIHDGPQEEQC